MEALFTQTALVFFILGITSMFTHAIKKWAKNEIEGNFISWYLQHPKATATAVMTCVGGVAVAILTNQLNDYNVGAQIIAVWGIGYGSDTLNNQGPA